LHFECGVWLFKTHSVVQLKEDYLKTLKVCREITYEEMVGRPLVLRVVQAVLRVFAPMM
jgi:cardiolipin synthase